MVDTLNSSIDDVDKLIDNVLVPIAQHMAWEKGLKLGQKIAHPSEPMICELQVIHNDGTVTIGLGAPESFSHRVLANECFDPDDCLKLVSLL